MGFVIADVVALVDPVGFGSSVGPQWVLLLLYVACVGVVVAAVVAV